MLYAKKLFCLKMLSSKVRQLFYPFDFFHTSVDAESPTSRQQSLMGDCTIKWGVIRAVFSKSLTFSLSVICIITVHLVILVTSEFMMKL